jgi:hypothetical protein
MRILIVLEKTGVSVPEAARAPASKSSSVSASSP